MGTQMGVAVVGCGRIAQMFHLPVLRELDRVRVVAVADGDPQARAAARALVPGAAVVQHLDALLEVPGVEAVVVCLPTHLHADAAVACLEAGRHVYVEKPLALDLAGAARVRRAWEANRCHGAVGFNVRLHPLHRQARELLAGGGLGTVVALRSVFSSAPRNVPEWKRSRATGGGALLDLASHHVDIVRYLLGSEVVAVSAAVSSRAGEDDTAALTLQLADGVVAQLLATASAAAGDRVDVLGTEASLGIDRMGRRRLTVVPAAGGRGGAAAAARVLREGALATYDRLRPAPEPSFRAALAAFVAGAAARRDGTVPGVDAVAGVAATIEDGYRAAAVVDAAERSAASGRTVPVEGHVRPA